MNCWYCWYCCVFRSLLSFLRTAAARTPPHVHLCDSPPLLINGGNSIPRSIGSFLETPTQRFLVSGSLVCGLAVLDQGYETFFYTKIMRVYGFDSIRVFFSMREMPQDAGDFLGNSARRISVYFREMCQFAKWPQRQFADPRDLIGAAQARAWDDASETLV